MSEVTSRDDDLEKQVEDITQKMFVVLSEWQAGVTVDWHSAKVEGRAELAKLAKQYGIQERIKEAQQMHDFLTDPVIDRQNLRRITRLQVIDLERQLSALKSNHNEGNTS